MTSSMGKPCRTVKERTGAAAPVLQPLLTAEDIEVEVLRIDFGIGAIRTDGSDGVVEILTQLVGTLADRDTGAFTMAFQVILVATDKFVALAGIGACAIPSPTPPI